MRLKEKIIVLQVATLFVGSIVGAGLSSGRELNQFFSVYGLVSLLGLFICCAIYIIFGKIIVHISVQNKVKSYDESISLSRSNTMTILLVLILDLSSLDLLITY
jgi:uncharacterized membrane protein YkvI